MKNIFITFSITIMSCTLFAQKDTYDQLKTHYDSLRKAENFEGALVAAKQMNTWSLKNETDTSLRYAVSLRYVGNCFNSLNQKKRCACLL